MDRADITILAPTCTIHSLARTRILAQMLSRVYRVEVVAPVFPGDEDSYGASGLFQNYIPVPVSPFPRFARSAERMLEAVSGRVVYACKTKATSMGVGLLARLRRKLPLLVDVDDREIYHCYPYSFHMSKNLLLSAKEWRHPNAYPLTLAMELIAPHVDHVTSVSSYFRKIYGGTVIPQAVDTELFDGGRFDRNELRRQWGLQDYKVVLFLGRPLPHKGLDEIVATITDSTHTDVRLVVVGGWTPYMDELKTHERVIFVGPQPFKKGPDFLAMADAVMVPQRVNPISLGQMPVKIPEAMAMGVPIIATDVSDIAAQLDGAGLVVPPGDGAGLTRALDRVLGEPELAKSMSERGRKRCVERYSVEAVTSKLAKVFESYV